MKISYFSSSPLSSIFANCVHVMNMSSAFSDQGHDVFLHAIGSKNEVSPELFNKYGVLQNFKIILKRQPKIRAIGQIMYGLQQVLIALFWVKPDLCYARCPVSAYFAALFGYKVVFELHSMPTSFFSKNMYGLIFRNPRVVRYVVISDALLSDLKSIYPAVSDSDRWLVAHDGANVIDAVGEFTLQGDSATLKIGYAGGLRVGNGLKHIISLAQMLPDYSFHIAGGTDEDVVSWKSQCETDNIFWYGLLSPKDVHAFLKATDILIAPYQVGAKTMGGTDTAKWMSPLKIFEYMAANRPMIVSDFEVLQEVIDSNSSLMVEPDDIPAWANAIEFLADNSERRVQVAENAFALLNEKYTWKSRGRIVIDGIENG